MNIKEFFKKFTDSSWHEYYNPYYYWWKVRKYFKRPKAHFVCGKFDGYFGFPCRTDYYYGKPKFCITGLGWKDKYNSPRHEWDPAIALVWTSPFKTKEICKFAENNILEYNKQYWIGFVFNWIDPKDDNSGTKSMATWEAILDIVCYNKPVKDIWKNHIWSYKDEELTIKDNMYGEYLLQ